MNSHPAIEKLEKVSFNNLEDWETYPTADYTCDNCKQTVAISLANLNKHQFSEFTNLKNEDLNSFKELELITPELKTNSSLDFYCPKCKRPVKIYYESWAGGHHGEAGHEIKYIVD